MVKVVFQDFFFSGKNINPKHEFKGNMSGGRSCPGPLAAILGEVAFFLVVSSENVGESFHLRRVKGICNSLQIRSEEHTQR